MATSNMQTTLWSNDEGVKRVLTYRDKNTLLFSETYQNNILHGKKNYYEDNQVIRSELYEQGNLVFTVSYKNNKITSIIFNEDAIISNVEIESGKQITNY
jgi:hypothetical protein